MVKTQISLGILFSLLLMADVVLTCLPVQCLRCDPTEDSCLDCKNATKCEDGIRWEILSNCTRAFEVTVNTTGSTVNEGAAITLTCVYDLPNVTRITWTKDGKGVGEDKDFKVMDQKLVIENVLSSNKGKYVCSVNSTCGIFMSQPHEVNVNNNNLIILVICGLSALGLVVIMGLAMKYKLRRDNAKHKERMKQRAQAAQAGQTSSTAPPPFTPRES
ncbi:uncharacterized protein LOC125008589 [Mugil cephalus]|uniref:uncharacterized protein LOC125008589 n=1 Tax=Mugil cephalus TaxID=48193 RepID=UPI001FB61D59|nr:uncharacterized protein LOC125008589 [Mugil cephalus]